MDRSGQAYGYTLDGHITKADFVRLYHIKYQTMVQTAIIRNFV